MKPKIEDGRSTVHAFRKNALEEVRLSVAVYKGKVYADIRCFFEDDDGEWKPTKKGLMLSPDLLSELEAGLVKLKAELHRTEQANVH